EKILFENDDSLNRLHALCALHITGMSPTFIWRSLRRSDKDEFVRAWAIELLCENNLFSDKTALSEFTTEFARLAREDKSPVVRLYLASALQRLPVENRWDILENLYAHAEDADDHNLPLMYWYAGEEAVGRDTAKATALLQKTKIPLL